jgi:hypothetical protein
MSIDISLVDENEIKKDRRFKLNKDGMSITYAYNPSEAK